MAWERDDDAPVHISASLVELAQRLARKWRDKPETDDSYTVEWEHPVPSS